MLHQLYMEYIKTKIKKTQKKMSNLIRIGSCFVGFPCSHTLDVFPPLVSHRYFMDFCTDGNFLQQQDRLWQSHLTEAGGTGLA